MRRPLVVTFAALRACLAALTDALARAEPEDRVLLDAVSLRVQVDSTLEDVDVRRVPACAAAVTRPDGLWEWQVRRDFVREVRPRARDGARRLAATLSGARTRRRFEIAMGLVKEPWLAAAFRTFRRRRLRGWAARVIRAALAGYVAPPAATASRRGTSELAPPRSRRRKGKRRRSKFVSYVAS